MTNLGAGQFFGLDAVHDGLVLRQEKHSRLTACCNAVKQAAANPRRRFDTILRRAGSTGPRGEKLASRSELSAFLAGVERRAFKQAVFAVRDEEAALDIVQDAMLRLSESYGDRAGRRTAAAVPAHPAERHPRLVPPPEGALAVDHAAVEPLAGARRGRRPTRWKPCRRPATRIARPVPPSGWSGRKLLK